MKKFILILSALYLIRNYFYRQANGIMYRFDFNIDYNFAAYGDRFGRCYKDWTVIFWKPFILFPFGTAFVLWYTICTICVLIIVWKLLEIKYGWILVFPFIKVAGWSLGAGNINPILAALCLTPLGCLVAGMVKPYLFCFMAIHAFVRFRNSKTPMDAYRMGDDNLYPSGNIAHKEKQETMRKMQENFNRWPVSRYHYSLEEKPSHKQKG